MRIALLFSFLLFSSIVKSDCFEKEIDLDGGLDGLNRALSCLSNKLSRLENQIVPPGAIVAWNSSKIPAGWVICEGSNGTPPLEDRFLLGRNFDKPNLPITGGKDEHNHEGSTKAEPVEEVRYSRNPKDQSNSEYMPASPDHIHELSTENSPNIPPYYRVFFICKM